MLKLGLMLNADRLVPYWAYEVLLEIEKSDYAKFELVIVNIGNPPKRKDALLYRLFRRIEKRITKPRPDYLKPTRYDIEYPAKHSLKPLVLNLLPICTAHRDQLLEADISEIKSYELDVILRFGFRILTGEILTAAKYGVWSYHHGDYRSYRGMPAGFWEVVNDAPTTGAMLQVLSEKLDNGKVIRAATYATHKVSPKRNANQVAGQAAHFLTEELKRLSETGVVRTEETSGKIQSSLYKAPTNPQMCRVFPTLLLKKVKSLSRKPWQWQIAHWQDEEDLKIAVPPKADVFWADPFIAFEQGQHFVFYEELERGQKAHISCATVAHGKFLPQGQALNTGTHLSYPFVFKLDGSWFMLPESMETGTIDLYWAKEFPLGWEKVRTLIRGVYAVDPTLLAYEGIYYIFANKGRKGLTNNSELYLWSSPNLMEGWQLHPASPVENDISLARPAGKIFMDEGCLYRPSQNPISGSVNFSLINRLNTREYQEDLVSSFKAPREFANLHTFNAEAGLSVVDVLKR